MNAINRKSRILKHTGIVSSAAALLAGVLVWIDSANAKPGLSKFQPIEMGRLEAAMWRSYYDGRWMRLGWQTLDVAHTQYGFSWWDSLRIGAHAARAALHFRKNTGDARCLRELEAYYGIIRNAVPDGFDVPEAARLELEWWKERRRNVAPGEYARTIAALTALIYGVSEESALPAATRRAQAMAYRDARRDGKMTDLDWQEVSRQLRDAYAALKAATDR